MRLLYGATPIEDVPYYNVIVRQLTEWSGSKQNAAADQFSIAEGIGGIQTGGGAGAFTTNSKPTTTENYIINTRQKYIQGIDLTEGLTYTAANPTNITTIDVGSNSGFGMVPNGNPESGVAGLTSNAAIMTGTAHPSVKGQNPIRRYQVQLALGIFNQEKLIPTKFMASQLAIEITLEQPAACMYFWPSIVFGGTSTIPGLGTFSGGTNAPASGALIGTPAAVQPTYQVTNVNLIPEILEFDASYDESFLKGLQTGGVPIKFSTWNNYRFSNNGVGSLNLQIQERSRSVKAIFCLQRRDPPLYQTDSGAAFFNTATTSDGWSTLQEYQYRIGGR